MATAAPTLIQTKLSKKPSKVGIALFGLALVVGLGYIAIQLGSDLSVVHSPSVYPFLLLGVALLIALGFEFVNGFHDTANAVATVIYTHSLEPHVAVVWSGLCNFLGVVVSTGTVAFAIITLLPVELILQVGRGAGFAMVFALLTAAILWNLGTWCYGLPSSSTHTMTGSIIGVGIANQLMSAKTGTSGVDWAQAAAVGRTLLVSPIFGFVLAGLLLLVAKAVIPNKSLYQAPKGEEPPQKKLSYGRVRNTAGNFVKADLASVGAAAAAASESLPDDFRISITNPPGKDAYLVSSFTWLLTPSKIQDPAKRKAIVDFLTWALTDGQSLTEQLTYARLPERVASRELKALARIQ